jgi:hypothetical protein
MLANDEVAVVTFDDIVDTPISIQQVSTAPAFSTVDLTPRNTTWIGGGIQQGAVQLAAASHTNKSMIVLTDGNENVHPYIGELPAGTITNTTYAIGFGLPGNVSDAALNQITSNTHGDLIITGDISTDEQRFNLTKYFVQVLAGVSNMNVILDPQGSLFLGSKHIIPFQLSDADVYADIIMLCQVPRLLDFQLETPDGKIIKPSTPASEPNIQYVLGQQVVFYRIVLPALTADQMGSHAGTWNAILSIKGANDIERLSNDEILMVAVRKNAIRASLPYSFVAHTYSNLNFKAYKIQESLKPGAAVSLFASLTEYDVPLSNSAVVWAQITNPDQSTFDLKFQKIDAATYSASFNTSLSGVYLCRLRAEGFTSKGTAFTREKTLSAGVYYGDYNSLPPSRPDEALCQLIQCFLTEKVLSGATRRRLSEMGINVKELEECLLRICPDKPIEQIPGLIHEAFVAARKNQLQAKPTLKLERPRAPKPMKPQVKPVRKVQPKKEFVTMFMPLSEDLPKEVKKVKKQHRKTSNKK